MHYKTGFDRMARVIDEFRLLYPDIPLPTIQAFIVIAMNPGISSNELMKMISVSQSAVSRHLSNLTEWSWRKAPGMNLIDLVEEPGARGAKVPFLNAKGRTFAVKLMRILYPEIEVDQKDFEDAKSFIKAVRSGAR